MSIFEDSIEVYRNMAMAKIQDCVNYQKEIERLNNIINELEKYLIEQVEKSYSNDYDNVLDKLDELKGSENIENN